MNAVNDIFGPPAEYSHPRLNNWVRRLKENPNLTVTMSVTRITSGIGEPVYELNVQFHGGTEPLPLESMLWNDELNAGLINLKVKAENPDQEAMRFSLGLRAALRRPEADFGTGYFHAVLFAFLKESEFAQQPDVAKVLSKVYSTEPYRDGRSFGICYEMILEAFRGRAHELTVKLGYSQDEARAILYDAVKRYLYDRYSIEYRQRVGAY